MENKESIKTPRGCFLAFFGVIRIFQVDPCLTRLKERYLSVSENMSLQTKHHVFLSSHKELSIELLYYGHDGIIIML